MANSISELDLSELQKLGQALYRQKDYEGALRCFDQAIVKDAKPPLTVLDNRAATHTKLGNLRAALRDGRQMIQQEKANCTGYLRAGKILQLLENPNAALDIYQLGMRKIPSSDGNMKMLRCLCNKLASQCAPPKAIDPLKVLPLELAEITLGFLRFSEIVNLLRVSKPWNDLLSSMPSLWADLDFSSASKHVNLGSVRQYVKRAKGMSTRVIIDRHGYNKENVLGYVATRCKELQDLRVSSGFISSSLLKAASCSRTLHTLIISSQCDTTLDMASQFLSQCPNIKRAEFHRLLPTTHQPNWVVDLPNLHSLTLINGSSTTHELSFSRLMPKIPNIRILSLQKWNPELRSYSEADFSGLLRLEYLDITGLAFGLTPKMPPSLRHLVMAKCCKLGRNTTWHPPDLPQLTRLSMAESVFVSQASLRQLLDANKGELLQLDISTCDYSVGDIVKLGYLKKVEELSLKNSPIDDDVASLLAGNLTELRRLDLSYTHITGVGVKALVTGLQGKLRFLGLKGCDKTSLDAIELARSMGVQVAYSFPDGGTKAKKVRYM